MFMESDKKFQPPSSSEQGKPLEVASEELTETGKIAKGSDITFQEKGFKEPMFGDKAREFEKEKEENNLLRMSIEQIARSFVDAYNNKIDIIKVDENLKTLLRKMKDALGEWLMGHAYETAKSEDIAAYIGLEVGKEIENFLTKTEGSQGKVKADKIIEKNYWGQFKEQVEL